MTNPSWTCACDAHVDNTDNSAGNPGAACSRRGFLGNLLALGAAASTGLQGAVAQPVATNAVARRIDIHHHVVPPGYAALLERRGGGSAPKWSPQMSLDDMDRNGIATSVLALMNPAASFGDVDADRGAARDANEYAARMASDHPGRFGSFATLPLLDVEGSLREITYALDTLNADGIGLMTSYGTAYLGDKRFWPIWDELNRRKAVIYTHPLQPACCRNPIEGLPSSAIEFPADTTRTIASLLFTGTANRYPDIRWIWSHGGGNLPFLWSRFTRQEVDMKERARVAMPNGLMAEVRRFYFDTAQANHEGAIKALRVLAAPSQILFGSDFPYRPAEEARLGLAARDFSADELAAIERGNAMRLMPKLPHGA